MDFQKEKPGWFARLSFLAAGLRLQPRRRGGEQPWSRFGRARITRQNSVWRSRSERREGVLLHPKYQSEIDELLYQIAYKYMKIRCLYLRRLDQFRALPAGEVEQMLHFWERDGPCREQIKPRAGPRWTSAW